MDRREKVAAFIAWRQKNQYPEEFKGRPGNNNQHVSEYTASQAVAASNNISHTNLQFLVAMYKAIEDKEIKSPDYVKKVSVGGNITSCICEVKTDMGYDIAIYSEDDAAIVAFHVNKDSNNIEVFPSGCDKMAMLGSLWDAMFADTEFFTVWQHFATAMDNDDFDTAWDSASVLNDNIYRRINGDIIPINSINENMSPTIIQQKIAAGQFAPTSCGIGEFEFIVTPSSNPVSKAVPVEDFVGKYQIDKNRVYTELEKQMMADNQLEDFYIVGENDIEICNDIVQTTNTKRPFRNFILVGPPGGGKSYMAKAIANGIMEPEVIFTCNPSNEIFDFVGQVMPPSKNELEKEAWEFAARLEELGGINYKNVAKVYGLPNYDDILIAPDDVYEEITGKRKTALGKEPSVSDVVKVWTTYMAEKFNDAILRLKVSMKEGAGFVFTETDFIKAIKNGWLIEVQEPNVILNEGVLVGLNSVLNEGVITLQTGQVVHRHRDSVIIFTTNNNLYGLRNMNQSFLDRSAETFFVDRPPVQAVADRIMSISGMKDRQMAVEMAKLGEAISKAMDKEGIDDGICGMRSLINWAIKASYTNPYDAAIKTVINKTSLDEKNRSRLLRKLDESYFSQFKGI